MDPVRSGLDDLLRIDLPEIEAELASESRTTGNLQEFPRPARASAPLDRVSQSCADRLKICRLYSILKRRSVRGEWANFSRRSHRHSLPWPGSCLRQARIRKRTEAA